MQGTEDEMCAFLDTNGISLSFESFDCFLNV